MNNIIEKYLDFSSKTLTKYFKLIFKNKLKIKDIQVIIKKYHEIRYYNYYNENNLQIKQSINNNLKNNLKEFISFSKYDQKQFKLLNNLVYNVLTLDNIQDEKNINITITNILNIYYKLYDKELDTKEELITLVHDNKKRRINYLKSFKTNKFMVKYEKLNNKIYYTTLEYNINFPSIYSNFAIKRVYNSEVINEQKMFILYNLITLKVLNGLINYDFKNKYIVTYPITLLSKEDKNKRFLNLIDNDILKDRFLIEFDYKLYLEYKDYIIDLIQNGFHFIIYFQDKYEFDDIEIKRFELFDAILVTNQELFTYYNSLNCNVLLRSK